MFVKVEILTIVSSLLVETLTASPNGTAGHPRTSLGRASGVACYVLLSFFCSHTHTAGRL